MDSARQKAVSHQEKVLKQTLYYLIAEREREQKRESSLHSASKDVDVRNPNLCNPFKSPLGKRLEDDFDTV